MRHDRRRAITVVAVSGAMGALLGVEGSASAQPTTTTSSTVMELDHDVPLDVGVTVTALALVLGSELGKADLAPRQCRWCSREEIGTDTLNRFDRRFRDWFLWKNTSRAANISDVLLFGAAPVNAFGGIIGAAMFDKAETKSGVDALIVLEALAINLAVNQVVKFAAGRERPFAHYREPEPDKTGGLTWEARRADENLSFYSGHSSTAFALATASSTVATLRGYRLAPVLWGTGMAIAATSAWLRIAADKHYITDVIVGALVGSAIGVLMPVVFHPRSGEDAGIIAP